MYKRQRMNEEWTGDWKGIVKDRVDNPWAGDEWRPWNVPEKVYDLVEPRVMELEELILCGTYPGDTRFYRTGLLRCSLAGCPCYGKRLRTYVNSTKTDRRAVKAMCDRHKLKYPLSEDALLEQQIAQPALQRKATAKLHQTHDIVAICAEIMTQLSKHDLPRDFWTKEEMFVFIYGLVDRKQRGEPVTQITIEEHFENVKMRHILKNQSILAIQNRPGNQLTEAQIMELAINAEQVKVEPMDAENDGTLVQEINVDDYGGEEISLNHNVNQPVDLSKSLAQLVASRNAIPAPSNSIQIPKSSDDRPSNSTGVASSTETSLARDSAAANTVEATTLTPSDGIDDPPVLENNVEDPNDVEDENQQKESDTPIDAGIPQYPGKCTTLFTVLQRWEPILSKEAKEKLFADFSLNNPLYQNSDVIEDTELRLTIRDEWITLFPSWLASFKPLNAKEDGSQRIPLSDIVAMCRMYRNELEARRTPVK